MTTSKIPDVFLQKKIKEEIKKFVIEELHLDNLDYLKDGIYNTYSEYSNSTSKKIEQLLPFFQVKIKKILLEINKFLEKEYKEFVAGIYEGYRPLWQQAIYYLQGRHYAFAGKIITNTLMSYHLFGGAVDIVFYSFNKKNWVWEVHPVFYETLGSLAEKENLIWGGKWKWKDFPHIQVQRSLIPEKTFKELKEKIETLKNFLKKQYNINS